MGGRMMQKIRSLIIFQIEPLWFGLSDKCLFSEELLLWGYSGVPSVIYLFSINNIVYFFFLNSDSYQRSITKWHYSEIWLDDSVKNLYAVNVYSIKKVIIISIFFFKKINNKHICWVFITQNWKKTTAKSITRITSYHSCHTSKPSFKESSLAVSIASSLETCNSENLVGQNKIPCISSQYWKHFIYSRN